MSSRILSLPYLVLLLALGAVTLIVELVIPRMIAPVFGNTLFSWTAIIAVVLVMLALGYRIGGHLTTKIDLDRHIRLFSLSAAVWVLILSVLGDPLIHRLNGLNILAGPLVAAALLAAVPAFLSAAVVPLVIQIVPGEPGDASGRCFAWSTVGSILGVLSTGYVLLPLFGVSGALLTGVVLIVVAAVAMRWYAEAGVLLAMVLGALFLVEQRSTYYLVDISNGHHRVRVDQADDIRSLYLDNTLEGRVKLGSDEPVAGYMVKLGELINHHVVQKNLPLQSAFFLGGGSFSIPRYLNSLRPGSYIHVSEIDPDVVKIAHTYLELRRDIDVSIGDGRNILKNDARTYDLIVNDAFQGLRKIPFHLTSHEFNRVVYKRLTDSGLYAANVRGQPAHSYLAASFIKTLTETFPYVYAEPASRTNVWVIASKKPLDWARRVPPLPPYARVLTDDHAPIEYLIVRDLLDERLRRGRKG